MSVIQNHVAVIQAGGMGKRLRTLTHDEIPKPMARLLGKPLMEWQIEALKKQGIREFIIIVGHLGHVIRDYIGDGSRLGITVRYIEENEPLGTAGAFFYLKDMISSDDFLFVYADVIFDIDVQKMLSFHRAKRSEATLFVHPNGHPFDSELVLLDDDGRVKGFDTNKNARDYWYENVVNAGVFLFSKNICDKVKQPKKIALEKELLVQMINDGEPIYGYRSTEYIKDVGTVERLTSVEQDIKRGIVSSRNLCQKQKAVFLDRDGTINKLDGFIDGCDKLVLMDGSADAIREINESGYLAIVVTNQPAVARGLCSIEDIRGINKKLQTLLGREGAYLDDIIFCPHHPDKGYPEENPIYKIDCDCRKPKTGMVDQMAELHNIDLSSSWMIGDSTVDMELARRAGLRSALVLTGERGDEGKYEKTSDITASNLREAVRMILESSR